MTALSRPLVTDNPFVSKQLDNSAGRIVAWSFRETSGAASATIELYDGSSPAGVLLATLTLTQAQSQQDWFGHHGIPYRGGLYLSVVAGTVKGQIHSVLESEWDDYGVPVVVVGQVEVNVVPPRY